MKTYEWSNQEQPSQMKLCRICCVHWAHSTDLWGVAYTMLILLLSSTRIGISDSLLPARLGLPLDTKRV